MSKNFHKMYSMLLKEKIDVTKHKDLKCFFKVKTQLNSNVK